MKEVHVCQSLLCSKEEGKVEILTSIFELTVKYRI